MANTKDREIAENTRNPEADALPPHPFGQAPRNAAAFFRAVKSHKSAFSRQQNVFLIKNGVYA